VACSSNRSRGKTFSLLKKHEVQSPPSLTFSGTGVPSLRVKWPEYYVLHSSPFNAEVKNEWCYTATPALCLHELCHNFHKIQQERAKQSGADLSSGAPFV
jgi:hypothetical protein